MTKQKKNFEHYAAIDIGSNAVRLLIKRLEWNKNKLMCTKEQFVRVPLRLGIDAFTKKEISKKKAKSLKRLMCAFMELMKIYDVVDYKVCATSALRDARNGKRIISWIKDETGVRVKILNGQEEAKLIYDNHFECMQQNPGNYMYVDVGGGSTEINLLVDGKLLASRSYNIGTLRVISNTVNPEEWERLKGDLVQLTMDYPNIDIIGSGGNINKLYRMVDRKERNLQRMPVSSLEEIHKAMSGLTFEERMRQYNLRYDRADVIVPAANIFLTVAAIIHASYIYVPTIGLADGIITELIAKKLLKAQKKLNKKLQEKDLDGQDDTAETATEETDVNVD